MHPFLFALALAATSTSGADVVATKSATVAPDLDVDCGEVVSSTTACKSCWERVRSLRDDLDAIAAADPLTDHWPSVLLGVVCIGVVTVIGEVNDWSPAAVTGLHASCAAAGLGFDAIIGE